MRVVADLDALLDGIDVLVVATPNSSHVEVALAGIERGLAVVVDKPAAPSAAQARRLLDAGGRLTVFQNRRWDGDFLTAARLLREGALGEPVRLRVAVRALQPAGRSEPLARAAGRRRGRRRAARPRRAPRRPGGAALRAAGRRSTASCTGAVRARRSRTTCSSRSSTRARCARICGWARSRRSPGRACALSGLAAGFACDGLDPQEEQLGAGIGPGDPGYGVGPPGRLGDEPLALERGRYEDFYAGVRDWALGAAPPPVDPADSVRVLEILEAARRSAEQRAVITSF